MKLLDGESEEQIDGIKVSFIKQHHLAHEVRMLAVYAIKEGIMPDMTDEELEAMQENWTYGWKLTIDGQQYGDFLTLSEPIFDVVHEQLVEQAREIIKAKKP